MDQIGDKDELFRFHYRRGWQIVTHCTGSGDESGDMQHFLRGQGIKLYTRLLDRNIKDLQEFTGHARIQNLVKYQGVW